MAQAAWQMQAEGDADIVRRLVARPLRLVAQNGAATVAEVVAEVAAPTAPTEVEAASTDLVRLKSEVTLMKAILKAERTENAHLRSQIDTVEAIVTTAETIRLSHELWADLVDQLHHLQR